MTELHLSPPEQQTFNFRPPDPSWVNSTEMEEVRKDLRNFDDLLAVWWSAHRKCLDPERPGRWRIMEWLLPCHGAKQANVWSHVLYWEHDDGSFRQLRPLDPLFARLRRIKRPLKQLAEKLDGENNELRAASKREMQSLVQECDKKSVGRYQGIQHTFGAHRGIRPRSDVWMPEIDPEYIKEVKKRGINRYG